MRSKLATLSAAVPAIGLLVLASACGSSLGTATAVRPSGFQGQLATSQPSFQPPTEPSDYGAEPQLSQSESAEPDGPAPAVPDGYVEKAVDAEALLVSPDGEPLAHLIVTEIEVDPKCASAAAEKPDQGHRIVVHLTVLTEIALAQSSPSTLDLTDANFSIDGPGGASTDYNKVSGDSCLPDEEQLSSVESGTSVKGIVELGSASKGGLILLTQSGLDGGWAWKF